MAFAFGTTLLAMAEAADVEVVFEPATPADSWDARTYREIWQVDGARIIAALERRTCLEFVEPSVTATVADAVSHSGGPEHPMRLRATYAHAVKQSTLVHELGHRHLWQLAERLDAIDTHMTLYLVLDRIWADVWGEGFVDERIVHESGWDEEYANAWNWARALSAEERERLWNELLRLNGFADDCQAASTISTQGFRAL